MFDLVLAVTLAGMAGLAFHRPWLGVLGLAALDLLHPQAQARGIMKEVPVHLLLLSSTVASTALAMARKRLRPSLPMDWRVAVLVLMWGLFLATTFQAAAPWAAWPMFRQVSGVMVTVLLILLLIDDREKLFHLLVTLSACIALTTLKGGYWAVMTGFSDRVYGPPGSQIYGNNEFVVAVAMNIPLLLLWRRWATSRPLVVALAVLVGLSYAAALSSWSRGGLLSLAVVTLFLFSHGRRKVQAIVLLTAGALLALALLPEAWFDRMRTLGALQADASAQGRIEAWRVGIRQALEDPYLGVGFEGWRFVSLNTPGYRDWHSAFVQVAAEHGLIGLSLWLALLLGTLLALTRLAWRAGRHGPAWAADAASLLRAALAAYAVGALFLGIAFWQLLFELLACAILAERLGLKERPFVLSRP